MILKNFPSECSLEFILDAFHVELSTVKQAIHIDHSDEVVGCNCQVLTEMNPLFRA